MTKPIKPIKDWCRLHGRKMDWLADAVGIHQGAMSRIANNHRPATVVEAMHIEDATEGGVTMRALATAWKESGGKS